MRYSNPILPGFHPDPSICRAGDDFYLVTSTFEYFPGVPIFHSRDLVNWKQIGHVLSRKSQLPLERAWSSGGIFAPTIRYHDGRFYMITTNVSHGGNFYVWTENPAGEWSDPVWIDEQGIDPSLFWDDGKVYFIGTSSKHFPHVDGIFQTELDLATGKPVGKTVHVWTGTGGQYPEGPHLLKKDGWYYLLIAEGGTEFGHMVTMARSRNAMGPFESCPKNPIFSHRSTRSPIQSTGHSDLVQDTKGNWWLVFLACRHVGYPKAHHIGRETFIVPVEWGEDGWPVVNGGKWAALEMDSARVTAPQVPWTYGKDDFDGPTPGLEWNFRRNPDPTAWALSEKKGFLGLRCTKVTLNDVDSPAFLGRRQEHLACAVSAKMDFAPQGDGEEAGLTALMNDAYHDDVAAVRRDGKRVVILRRRMGSLTWESKAVPLAEGPVTIEVKCEPEWYHFRVTQANGQVIELGKAETRHLSTEIAGGFTGVYFGMYATGNGADSPTMAWFDWFDYKA